MKHPERHERDAEKHEEPAHAIGEHRVGGERPASAAPGEIERPYDIAADGAEAERVEEDADEIVRNELAATSLEAERKREPPPLERRQSLTREIERKRRREQHRIDARQKMREARKIDPPRE